MSIFITGLGVITPLGHTVASLWEALLAGKCAAREWGDLKSEGFRIATACRVVDFTSGPSDRGQRMALAAARQALSQANLPLSQQIGIYVGSTMGESAAFERAATGSQLQLEKSAASAFPDFLQKELKIEGPKRAYGTACAAGNYAIGSAAADIQAGFIDAAIAGGVEPFSRIAMVGFNRSRAMSPEKCRPFDKNRRGMQLGEAAAFVILEREEDVYSRKAAPIARVKSLGLSCDAHHPTAPKPDGSGMVEAMRQVIRHSGLEPEEIGWICAHGSGTRASDAAEARAIQATFNHKPAITGVKGSLGHSLGAATAVETVITALTLQYGILPPTANHVTADDDFDIDIVQKTRFAPNLKWALNSGYAFGGINSALLLGVC